MTFIITLQFFGRGRQEATAFGPYASQEDAREAVKNSIGNMLQLEDDDVADYLSEASWDHDGEFRHMMEEECEIKLVRLQALC